MGECIGHTVSQLCDPENFKALEEVANKLGRDISPAVGPMIQTHQKLLGDFRELTKNNFKNGLWKCNHA